MAQVALQLDQQKDNLCGPYCVARILGVDQDVVALAAGTALPPPSERPSVPPGARSWTQYTTALRTASASESGTSPDGLARAIRELSAGELEAVPVRGDWTADVVTEFVDRATAAGARLIANIRTGKLWGGRASAEEVLAELRAAQVEGPAPDWDVGHFVELNLVVHVRGGSLVVVHDTYPSLGLGGYHVQPPRAIAAALLRGDGREGGILAVVPKEQSDAVRTLVAELGLQAATWDNGSRS
jgi:hypothetical protein